MLSANRSPQTGRYGWQVAHTRTGIVHLSDAGLAPGSEFLWPYHEQVYWDLTQRMYREVFDPDYDGAQEAGTPYCVSGTPACDADTTTPRDRTRCTAPWQECR